MKQILLSLLVSPLLATAQNKSRFENDTLYSSSGFKIYKGQTLHFGKAGSAGGFKYMTIKNGVAERSLENNSITVRELSNFSRSLPGYRVIDITGSIAFKDGTQGSVVVNLAYDQAIGSRLSGAFRELILPESFLLSKEEAAAFYTPKFDADTLYTSCGYKIYKGQVLQFGLPAGRKDNFRHVKILNKIAVASLQSNQITVSELRSFEISALGNAYITVKGSLQVNNNERKDIILLLAFDNAIGNLPENPAELIVPEPFKSRTKNRPEPVEEKM
jgi:hypothetical protein